MLTSYFSDLVTSVRDVFSNLSLRDAYCMILDCINNSDRDSGFAQAMLDVMKATYINVMQTKFPELSSESEIQAIADLYREGGFNGTRNPNCN